MLHLPQRRAGALYEEPLRSWRYQPATIRRQCGARGNLRSGFLQRARASDDPFDEHHRTGCRESDGNHRRLGGRATSARTWPCGEEIRRNGGWRAPLSRLQLEQQLIAVTVVVQATEDEPVGSRERRAPDGGRRRRRSTVLSGGELTRVPRVSKRVAVPSVPNTVRLPAPSKVSGDHRGAPLAGGAEMSRGMRVVLRRGKDFVASAASSCLDLSLGGHGDQVARDRAPRASRRLPSVTKAVVSARSSLAAVVSRAPHGSGVPSHIVMRAEPDSEQAESSQRRVVPMRARVAAAVFRPWARDRSFPASDARVAPGSDVSRAMPAGRSNQMKLPAVGSLSAAGPETLTSKVRSSRPSPSRSWLSTFTVSCSPGAADATLRPITKCGERAGAIT